MTALSPQTDFRPVPIDADMFDVLARAGAFAAMRKVELRDGEVVELNAVHLAHGEVLIALGSAVFEAIRRADLNLRVAGPVSVRLSDFRVPEPDMALCDRTGDEGFAPRGIVRLAIEVAHTSLADDMGWKLRAYAQASIPEYWVVDVMARLIRQHWSPQPEELGYRESAVVPFGEAAAARTIPDLVVDTRALAAR